MSFWKKCLPRFLATSPSFPVLLPILPWSCTSISESLSGSDLCGHHVPQVESYDQVYTLSTFSKFLNGSAQMMPWRPSRSYIPHKKNQQGVLEVIFFLSPLSILSFSLSPCLPYSPSLSHLLPPMSSLHFHISFLFQRDLGHFLVNLSVASGHCALTPASVTFPWNQLATSLEIEDKGTCWGICQKFPSPSLHECPEEMENRIRSVL